MSLWEVPSRDEACGRETTAPAEICLLVQARRLLSWSRTRKVTALVWYGSLVKPRFETLRANSEISRRFVRKPLPRPRQEPEATSNTRLDVVTEGTSERNPARSVSRGARTLPVAAAPCSRGDRAVETARETASRGLPFPEAGIGGGDARGSRPVPSDRARSRVARLAPGRDETRTHGGFDSTHDSRTRASTRLDAY